MAKVAARDVYLFECSPFDPATGAAVTVRRGTEAWTTDAGDTPATTLYAPGMRIQGFGASILDASSQMFAGFVEMDAGKLDLLMARQADGSYDGDDLLRYAWNGYAFTIYKVAKGALFSAKTTFLVGFVTGAAASEGVLQLTITSKNATLAAKQVQETKFWGRKHGLRFTRGSTHNVSMGDNLDQTSSFTLEALVRYSALPVATNGILVAKYGANGWTFSIDTAGKPAFYLDVTAGVVFDLHGAAALDTDRWYMLSAVYDTTANLASLYVDGVFSASAAATTDPENNTGTLYFGGDGGSSQTFPGDIAKVRIWEVARSGEEIADALYGGFHGVPAGLVGWYKFGEGTGTTLGDSSESLINGTITGATWIGTYEGEEALAGIAKPWAVGVCLQREPILIDSVGLTYALCDRGFGNNPAGDYPAGQPVLTDGGVAIDLDSSSGSGSAPKTYYFKNATATSSSHGKMEEGTAPSSATTATGWTIGTTVANRYSLMLWGTERAAATFGSTALPNAAPTTNDCLRSESTITGRFQAGTWTIDCWMRSATSGGEYSVNECYGRARARVWHSANADGSTATEITSGAVLGNTVKVVTSEERLSRITFTGAQTDLTARYLFVQLAWQITVAGGEAGDDVRLRVGSSLLSTAPFNSSGVSPVEELWQATVASGKFKFDADLGLVRLGTAPTYRLAADFCAADYDSESTADAVPQMRAVIEESGGFDASVVSLTSADFQDDGTILESGIHVPAGNATCMDILRRILHNQRASGGFQSDGIFRARSYTNRIVSALTPAFAYTESDVIRGSFQIIAVLDPIREVLVKYAPYQPPHGPSEIAGAVSQADRFDLQREFRRAFKTRSTDRDGRAWSNHREGARKIVIETDMTADWMLAYTIPPLLDVFDTQVMVAQFQLTTGTTSKKPTIGDLVTMTFPRFGFDAGVECLVTGVEESQPGNRITVQIMDATTLAEA